MTKLIVASHNFAKAPKHLIGYSWRKPVWPMKNSSVAGGRTFCVHMRCQRACMLLCFSFFRQPDLAALCKTFPKRQCQCQCQCQCQLTSRSSVKWARWILYHAYFAADTLDMGFFHEMRPKRKVVLYVHSSMNEGHKEEVQLRKHYSTNWEG